MENPEAHPQTFETIEDPVLTRALNELGRSINLFSTYGTNHPAAVKSIIGATAAMQTLFAERKKIIIGAFNGIMTVDEQTVTTVGTLQKSLERRLVRLNITGLKIDQGVLQDELATLVELLAATDATSFQQNLSNRCMEHIESKKTSYKAVQEGQSVGNICTLSNITPGGILVLEDDSAEIFDANPLRNGPQVGQIIAFLKGDLNADSADVGEALTRMASDPDQLGRIIMESVAIRQSTPDLLGESLNDIVLGCLRRTYSGLREQPAFQSKEGKAELKKMLLLLEESVLENMRRIAGEEDPVLDRQIVQTIHEMDKNLNFEIAAAQYMEHREAMKQEKEELFRFIQTQGPEKASNLLQGSGFPGNDWRKIVIESEITATKETSLPDGLKALTSVFDKLEKLMQSEAIDGTKVKHLLGQAHDNLDDTLGTTREKLAALSSTIGGQAHRMSRPELLASLAEVAQELMQPLTAIKTSVEMLLHGYVGDVSEEQQDLLELASNSGEHLQFLMDMLINIVGCPTNKGIDNRFHTTSEQVQLIRDAEGQEHLPLNLFP
jgi:signal transduction histidine kinase